MADLIDRIELMRHFEPFGREIPKDHVIEVIARQEAVNRWVPVEEQKPHGWCFVTDVHRNVPFVAREIVTVGEDCIDGETLNTLNIDLFTGEKLPIEDLKKIIHGNRIIAWMPLPEPYKGEDE